MLIETEILFLLSDPKTYRRPFLYLCAVLDLRVVTHSNLVQDIYT